MPVELTVAPDVSEDEGVAESVTVCVLVRSAVLVPDGVRVRVGSAEPDAVADALFVRETELDGVPV